MDGGGSSGWVDLDLFRGNLYCFYDDGLVDRCFSASNDTLHVLYLRL